MTAMSPSSLVDPDVRANTSRDNKLVPLSGVSRYEVANLVEGQEPDAIDDCASMTDLFVWLSVVLSDQTEPHIGHIAPCGDLGISHEMPQCRWLPLSVVSDCGVTTPACVVW
jgi:hypothetical protein